jgi:hypothetical protein
MDGTQYARHLGISAEYAAPTNRAQKHSRDGHGWAYTFEERLETLKLMFDRSYGRPSQPIQADQQDCLRGAVAAAGSERHQQGHRTGAVTRAE